MAQVERTMILATMAHYQNHRERAAASGQRGLEQRELIRAQPVPGQGDRSLLSFPARPFCWPFSAGYGTASKRLKTELQPNSGGS